MSERQIGEKQWNDFFDVLNDIINQEDMTHEEKKSSVLEAAKEIGTVAEIDLEEFVSWFGGEL